MEAVIDNGIKYLYSSLDKQASVCHKVKFMYIVNTENPTWTHFKSLYKTLGSEYRLVE